MKCAATLPACRTIAAHGSRVVRKFPEGDSDFSLRWHLIKADFSKRLPITERRSAVRGTWNLAATLLGASGAE